MEAMQDCDHTSTYNMTYIQGSEIVIAPKPLSQQVSIGNVWEEKEKSFKELQATFQVLLLLAGNTRADCMVRLRGYFRIPRWFQ